MAFAYCENNAKGHERSNFQVIMRRLINIWLLLHFQSLHVFVYRLLSVSFFNKLSVFQQIRKANLNMVTLLRLTGLFQFEHAARLFVVISYGDFVSSRFKNSFFFLMLLELSAVLELVFLLAKRGKAKFNIKGPDFIVKRRDEKDFTAEFILESTFQWSPAGA